MGTSMQRTSVFAKPEFAAGGYPFKYDVTMWFDTIAGGIPSNPQVAEAWIRSKGIGLADLRDELVVEEVAKVMTERGLPEAEAVEEVAMRRLLNGFKRDENGLYVEGRQLKACLREAGSIAADVGKLPVRGFGLNKKKGLKSFFSEHVFITASRLYLVKADGSTPTAESTPVTEPSDINQGFVHTFRGNGISYRELVHDAEIRTVVEADYEFAEDEWAAIWQTAQNERARCRTFAGLRHVPRHAVGPSEGGPRPQEGGLTWPS